MSAEQPQLNSLYNPALAGGSATLPPKGTKVTFGKDGFSTAPVDPETIAETATVHGFSAHIRIYDAPTEQKEAASFPNPIIEPTEADLRLSAAISAFLTKYGIEGAAIRLEQYARVDRLYVDEPNQAAKTVEKVLTGVVGEGIQIPGSTEPSLPVPTETPKPRAPRSSKLAATETPADAAPAKPADASVAAAESKPDTTPVSDPVADALEAELAKSLTAPATGGNA